MGNTDKNKRVLIISPSNTGTIPRRSLGLYEAMKTSENIEVKLVHIHHYSNGFPEYDQSEWHEGESSFLHSLLDGFSRVRWLRKIKKNFKPDMTISMLTGCSSISVLSGEKDVKIGVFRAPTSQIKHLPLQYFVAKLSYRFIYPKLDYLFCISKEIENYIKQSFPWIPAQKLRVVYNVFDFQSILNQGNCPIPDNEQHIFEDGKVLLSVGRVEPIKCPERLVLAFINSGLRENGYKLVFVGEDIDGTMIGLKKIITENKIDNNVFFLGRKLNPYCYMSRSKAIVSASKSEGLPGVLIESLILNKPVVSTNASRGVWEILSCDNCYEKELTNCFYGHGGIITPNSIDEKNNISQLSNALLSIVNEEMNLMNDIDIQKFKKEHVVNEYLKILNI